MLDVKGFHGQKVPRGLRWMLDPFLFFSEHPGSAAPKPKVLLPGWPLGRVGCREATGLGEGGHALTSGRVMLATVSRHLEGRKRPADPCLESASCGLSEVVIQPQKEGDGLSRRRGLLFLQKLCSQEGQHWAG